MNNNNSANHGIEGPTRDASINAIRLRQQKNMLATLLLSLGTPMVLGGDEFGRTQGGNNNAYCQDNPISWFDENGEGVDWARVGRTLTQPAGCATVPISTPSD